MMGGRRLRAVGVAFVVMAACTSSPESGQSVDDAAVPTSPSPSSTASTPADAEPLLTSFSPRCTDFRPPPQEGQITFVRGTRVYAASPGETRARCIGRTNEGVNPMWGGDADRLFLATSTGARVLFDDGPSDLSPSDTNPVAFGLSRPIGESVLFTSGDKRHLYKIPATGGDTQDISFLRRHDEVLYHPAGRHIAAVGIDRSGTYGIFVANNEGTDVNPLVLSEDAKRVFSLTFSPEGLLYYVAEHEDHYDVHSVSMQGSGRGEIATGGLATYYSSKNVISEVVVSQFGAEPFAIQAGTSDDSCPSKTIIWDDPGGGSGTSMSAARKNYRRKSTTPIAGNELAGRATKPVGWLPSGDLVVEVVGRSGCDSSGEIYLWNKEDGVMLLTTDASAVAVRGLLPDPPDPPTKEPEVVA